MTKKTAALLLVLLVVCFVFVGLVTTPEIGFSLNQNLNSWFQIGQYVGQALAEAFGNQLVLLAGIILFIV
jgi:UPF0716 family protein affecting phage T7 exclusion